MQLRDLFTGFVWLFGIARIATTTPTHRVPEPSAILEPHSGGNIPARDANILPKRAEWIANLGNGWAGYFETWESFIPTQLAASVLTNFYSLILDRLQSSTSSLGDPVLFQAFEWDNIRLEFSSDARNIPWEFMATFAARMAATTQRGFTSQFNAVYVHMATEQSIRISLMVLRDAIRT